MKTELEAYREAFSVLEDALQEAGDDYPGSSLQEWWQYQVKVARELIKPYKEGTTNES